MSNSQRMGKGLDALWGEVNQTTNTPNLSSDTVQIDIIFPNPKQPRKIFTAESLEELAHSIAEQGIIQPLLVRPKTNGPGFELVAGERRYRAAKLAGLNEVPVFIRELDDIDVMAAALIENIQREDLTPIEEAQALFNLREKCGITQDELASKLGKSRSAIANSLRLLQLSSQTQDDLLNGNISAGHARAILSLSPNNEAQENLRQVIISKALSVRDAEAAVQCFKDKSIFPWDELTADENNIPNKKKSSQSNRLKSPYIQELQGKIKQHIDLKTQVSGNEDRGRVTITFTNKNELEHLLNIIGLNK